MQSVDLSVSENTKTPVVSMRLVANIANHDLLHSRDTQLRSNNKGCLLPDCESRRVGILGVQSSLDAITERDGLLTEPTLPGAMDMSATFKPCTPYTFRLESTTPPLSRGFMLHVPSYGPDVDEK